MRATWKVNHLGISKQNYYLCVGIFVVFALSILLLPPINNVESLPLPYSNYTSDKYQIEFEYPSTWTLEEKSNRFDEGAEITISNDILGRAQLTVSLLDALPVYDVAPNIQTATVELHNRIINNLKYDYRTIEYPSTVDIGGVKSGTFLITFEDKYETDPVRGASQYWITYSGGRGYLFTFISTPETFDNPESTEMRDHFINSIRFSDLNN